MRRAILAALVSVSCGLTVPEQRVGEYKRPAISTILTTDAAVDCDSGDCRSVDCDAGQCAATACDGGDCDGGCGGGNPVYVDGGPLWEAPAVCANARERDLPVHGGLLPSSSSNSGCPASAPTRGASCGAAAVSCTYGSLQPGCFNQEYRCTSGLWVEGLHSDPNAPWNASQCQSGLPVQAGCPDSHAAFFTRTGQACALPAGTVCNYGNSDAACVQFKLGCDGSTWHRLPDDAWSYCRCERGDSADGG